MPYVNFKVACGKVYRYLITTHAEFEEEIRDKIKIGDTLPDLKIPDVEPPCSCKVVEKWLA